MEPTETSGDPGALFVKAAALEKAGTPFALATVVAVSGSAPRHLGAKMIVLSDGSTFDTLGGGILEKIVTEDGVSALSAGESLLKEYDLVGEERGGIGAACGGKVKVFIEVRGDRRSLVIVGGGHVGLALARAAHPLGLAITVVDPREEFSKEERFPRGTKVVRADPTKARIAEGVRSGAFVVILTHSHALDKEALRIFLPTKPAYIGMIGSRRKVKGLLSELAEEGVGEEALENVFSPVGLDIGAETPEEIAVSIVAEIVHALRKGGVSPASLRLQRE